MKPALKILLLFFFFLAVFLFIDFSDFLNRNISGKLGSHYFLLYFITYIGLVGTSCVFLLSRSKIIRYSFLVFLFISLTVSISSKLVLGEGFTVGEISLIIQEWQWAGDTTKMYSSAFIEAIVISLVIVSIATYCSAKWITVKTGKRSLYFSTSFIFCYVFIFFKTQSLISVFPCVYNVPGVVAYNYISTYSHLHHDVKMRNAVKLIPAKKGAKHILFLVEESVRGDALTINNKNVFTTPFLKKIDSSYYNYGIASSVSNFSIS